MSTAKPATTRIASLDQFRGYTVAGMFLVNFLGVVRRHADPASQHKNKFCSYADTIMPQFFFAVGFAFRLTFGRRTQAEGLAAAYGHVVRRMLGLALVAMVIYNAPNAAATWEALVDKGPLGGPAAAIEGTWFQTLMHIAVTSLWITAGDSQQAAGADRLHGGFGRLADVSLVLVLFRLGAYRRHRRRRAGISVVDHAHDHGHAGLRRGDRRRRPTAPGEDDRVVDRADGGRLAAVVRHDAVRRARGPGREPQAIKAACARSRCVPSQERLQTHTLRWAEPPFVPPPDSDHRKENYWMMSQRAATLSYHVFGGGLFAGRCMRCSTSRATCGAGNWACFARWAPTPWSATSCTASSATPSNRSSPTDAPGWYVTAGFLLYFGITYLFIRHLEKNNIYLKL